MSRTDEPPRNFSAPAFGKITNTLTMAGRIFPALAASAV